jgi:serine/threonine-protein kinase
VLAGRYVLGEVLGTGGMATVWRARDEVLSRDVAVKVLNQQFAADPGFAARFEREARHAAGLSHPRLVTVFDCGVDGSTPYIVMELVAGYTLRQVLDRVGTLPPREAVRIAAAVCEALEVAHAAGLIHRDIKPANIVLAGSDVKVLDFGIARVDGGTGATGTAVLLGTAAYLSPEQASGRPAGPQADLYALGCVLFEMLTGAPPFVAESPVGLAYRHVHDNPGRPSALRPDLPVRLDQITGRLLAKDPSNRPASAAAARAGLLGALDTDGTAVLPAPVGRQRHGRTPSGNGRTLPGNARALSGNARALSGNGRTPSGRRPLRRPRRVEVALAVALVAALIALIVVLQIGSPGTHQAAPPAPRPTATTQAHKSLAASSPAPAASALPPAAVAAAAFTGDLTAAVADGQLNVQAGQNMFQQLEQLLFRPAGETPLQIQQQYQQLVQVYDQDLAQALITGPAISQLHLDLQTLGTSLGALLSGQVDPIGILGVVALAPPGPPAGHPGRRPPEADDHERPAEVPVITSGVDACSARGRAVLRRGDARWAFSGSYPAAALVHVLLAD